MDPDILLHLIRALKEEYAIKRGYLLRCYPHIMGDDKVLARDTMESEGLMHVPAMGAYRTLVLDLSPPIEELRKNLLQKWRYNLKKAEKNGLEVVEGTNAELYQIFLKLMPEMLERKRLNIGIDFQKFGLVQEALPEHLKMRIMVCVANREPVCAIVCSAIGASGVYLLGASGNKGIGLNGSYLLHWRMLQWLKENGFRSYDLGGIDPLRNPGGYQFKMGIAGRDGKDEELLGEFQGTFTAQARIAAGILKTVRYLRHKSWVFAKPDSGE